MNAHIGNILSAYLYLSNLGLKLLLKKITCLCFSWRIAFTFSSKHV